MNSRLAIFLPVYDRPHLTEICLRCLSRQTTNQFDIFIVNDGGPYDAQYQELVARFRHQLSIDYTYLGPETPTYRADLALNVVLTRLKPYHRRVLRLDDDVLPEPQVAEQHLRFDDARIIVLGEIRSLMQDFEGLTEQVFLAARKRPYILDIRLWNGQVPSDYDFVSCWSAHASYPVRELQQIGGTDPRYIGVKANGDIDLASRLIHHQGCCAQFWQRAITYFTGPTYQTRLLSLFLSSEEGYQYEMLLSDRMADYRKSCTWIEECLGFTVPKISDNLTLPETWSDMSFAPVTVPHRGMDDDRDVVATISRQIRCRRGV